MTLTKDTIDVALFPIPNAVTFPGTVFPLHVFEPRYRRLVRECVGADRMVAISHVKKTIHQPKHDGSLEQALSANQATYLPQPTFSAGRCEILETTADGRILARIHVTERLAMIEERQSLPYRIVSCEPVLDEDASPTAELEDFKRAIHERLIELVGREHPEMAEALKTAPWAALPPSDYSFRVFQVLQLSPDIMQLVLESRRAEDRLDLIWSQIAPDQRPG
jgi:Lon protease-like protein